MGSIVSNPKPAQQVVYTPPATKASEPSAEEVAKARAESLLRRSRSALGNIVTGFRGILDKNATTPQRKSLLGE